jgi:flagellin
MALSVATNSGALMAQAAASSVNKEMQVSMERLASGKRINGASDDAAGVAIASRLSSEIRGTNQAIRNAMDGQAMIDTAEGAHQEIESILQRMRELAVQAANDTNNSDDRANIQSEAASLSTEIDRISATTSWAGQNLLNASVNSGSFDYHVGSRGATADAITVTIGDMSSSTLGVSTSTQTNVSATLTELGTNAMQVGGAVKAGNEYNFTVNGEAMAYTAVTADENSTLATAQANIAAKIKTAIEAADNDHAGMVVTTDGNTVRIDQSTVTFSGVAADSITDAHNVTGDELTMTFTDFNSGTPASFTINGETIAVTAGEFTTGSAYGMNASGMVSIITDKIAASTNLKGLTVAVTSPSSTKITIAVTKADGTSSFLTGASATSSGSSTISFSTSDNAQSAIALIDTAIKNVNLQRANLGAVSNRLDSTVNNLTNISTNLAAGKGRIEDADFAAETTNLAKTQILQQASTAMLAQANASKQNVLSLLQG